LIQRNEKFPYHELSVEERLLLVEDIWDSIAEELEHRPLTDAQRKLVDERLKNHDANPQDTVSWEELKANLQSRLDELRSR